MLDFLVECNIDSGAIKDLENTYSELNLYSLQDNEDEVVKIINYFRGIGIDCVEEILVFNLRVFLYSYNEILEKFNRYNIEEIVKYINDDYMFIDKVLV